MDKLSAMATFAQVVETGSFTKAAEVLAVPKARVSQRVSDLERYLGVRLLHRTTRALSLTEDGKAYYGRCLAILQEIDELEGTLHDGTAQPRGRLRIEALVSVARWVIAPRLFEFKALYPEISVRLGSNDRIRPLLEEGIDVAVRGGPLEDSSLIARHVCDVHFGLYASPAYLEANGSPGHPRELVRHHLLSWFGGQRHPFAWRLETEAETVDLSAADGLQFDDPDAAIASCMTGSGICPGSPFAVDSWVRAGMLVPVLPRWCFPARPIHILYPSNKQLSIRVRTFVDWLIGVMAGDSKVRMTPLDLAESL